jgi:hypothetical protein
LSFGLGFNSRDLIHRCGDLKHFSEMEGASFYFAIEFRYSASTLSRAQGVRRRNFRLDFMLGSL